jgi:hypothetical protein
VDLNPELATYIDLESGQFPMKFVNGIQVNRDDYKTSKLVLQRIDGISGGKFDTFVMGSHATDYDIITDPTKRKYRDAESIVDGAKNDYARVTLGNGGSYQKRYVNYKEDLPPDGYAASNDLYAQKTTMRDKDGKPIKDGESDKQTEKYTKNKHFFLDPFALTIAQWCYVKLNSQESGNAN